jgi:hypothetical protein
MESRHFGGPSTLWLRRVASKGGFPFIRTAPELRGIASRRALHSTV